MKKNYQFLSSIKREAHERNFFLFFLPCGVHALSVLARYASAGTSYSPAYVCLLSVTSRCSIETDGQIEFIYGTGASFDLFYTAV